MAGTRLADIIVPDVWNDYILEKTAEKSALRQSGILATDSTIQTAINGGGEFVNMPFFNDLSGDAEEGGIGFDGDALTPDKITAKKDVAAKIFRAKAWDASDFSGLLSGADPVGAIADRVADYWIRQENKILIDTLKGVFTTALSSTHTLDISALTGGAEIIGSSSFIDASFKLGDSSEGLVGVAMHSATYAKLLKDQMIEFVQPAGVSTRIPTYLDKTVIVDDSLPVTAGVYTAYLFGNSAIGYGDIALGDKSIETDRDTLAGVDVLISRVGKVMHPRGVKYATTTANPTTAQLQAGASWAKVYSDKNIRIVAFKHKIA